MGFYLRKSIRVGAMRFNLSKSGIGMSAGVRGFRVGSGPRGAYVHAGAKGFYYRASLPSGTKQDPNLSDHSRPTPRPSTSDVTALTEIDSGHVAQMTDTSAEALLKEMNEKQRKPRLAGWGLLLTALAAFTFGVLGLVGGLLVTWFLVQWDLTRRTTVLLYDMEESAQQRFQALHDAFDQFAACGGRWHKQAEGKTSDQKRNAGANTLIRRKPVKLGKQPPTTLKTNIDVPTLPAGRQTLCFLPDRLLVFDNGSVGAVAYDALAVETCDTQFIENERPPSDAIVVGHTWRYVNKNGGPDKRFNDNRQLPICRYEEIWFRSGTGLSEAFQVSRPVGEGVRAALRAQVGVRVTV